MVSPKWPNDRRWLRGENIARKYLREMGTSWKGVKREALNRIGWSKSVRDSVGLRHLNAAVSC